MIRTHRPDASTQVLVTRVVGGLGIIALYAAFRLPELVSPVEAILTWVGAAVCLWLVLTSAEQLVIRRRDRLDPDEPSPLELTDVLPTPVPRTPVTMLDDTDRFRIHGPLYADTIAFEQGRSKLIDRGDFVEPTLLTHEFTPARGVPFTEIITRLAKEGMAPRTTAVAHALHEQMDTELVRRLMGGGI